MLHLLHPALVHFSVAFLVTGALCETVGILRRHDAAERFGSVLVLAGTAVLVPTVATGVLAANTVDLPTGAEGVLVVHERLGFSVLAVFLVSQFWKAWWRGRLPEGQRRPYAALLVAGVALVVAGAFFGGELVYGYGVGTRAR